MANFMYHAYKRDGEDNSSVRLYFRHIKDQQYLVTCLDVPYIVATWLALIKEPCPNMRSPIPEISQREYA